MKGLVRIGELLTAGNRLERLRVLGEIRLNLILWGGKLATAPDFAGFAEEMRKSEPELAQLLEPGGEAERALEQVETGFRRAVAGLHLPYPTLHNADPSFAKLCYALARHGKPAVALETGVAYGISSAMVLQAMEANGFGKLLSVDLPPLADSQGEFTGVAVPQRLWERWKLYRGSNRRLVPEVLREAGEVGLLVSDSANVFTLQRYEYNMVWPRLAPGGAALFNNIGRPFWAWVKHRQNGAARTVRQVRKEVSYTGLIVKR